MRIAPCSATSRQTPTPAPATPRCAQHMRKLHVCRQARTTRRCALEVCSLLSSCEGPQYSWPSARPPPQFQQQQPPMMASQSDYNFGDPDQDGWVTCTANDVTYYYNIHTQKSRWYPPGVPSPPPEGEAPAAGEAPDAADADAAENADDIPLPPGGGDGGDEDGGTGQEEVPSNFHYLTKDEALQRAVEENAKAEEEAEAKRKFVVENLNESTGIGGWTSVEPEAQVIPRTRTAEEAAAAAAIEEIKQKKKIKQEEEAESRKRRKIAEEAFDDDDEPDGKFDLITAQRAKSDIPQFDQVKTAQLKPRKADTDAPLTFKKKSKSQKNMRTRKPGM
eukprot:m.81935 g.81935  ORF g.81935 m.81935 type:complete len:334 (+) comp8244_c0_seq3:419-1420(+)